MDLFIIVFLISFLFFQILGFVTFKREILWLSSDYVWLGLAAISLFFYAQKAEQDNAKRVLPNYNTHLSHMRQMTKSDIFFYIGHLDIMYEYGLGNGVKNNDEYRSDILLLQRRIKALIEPMQSKDWPDRMEQFFDCAEISAKLVSETTRLTAATLCEKFELVHKSRENRNAMAKTAKGGIASALEIHIYPIFFALALAIRLGRTTADVRRKQPAKSPPVIINPNDGADTSEV
ncbi:hypothetical protein ICY20_27330 [Pseudomonas sp. P115]|uniref:hypothetical protein n=1 Tax=Pseudomonas pisciculturae TaxID=2730413 RepID=UPI00189234CB|nr:hypothetical protein [Pseudomonas pisciculturae]MBF6031476.1 hypothetical protein [Pseudomonas pisciculturae]